MKSANKRLSIFVSYDRDGIIDRYVFYILDELRTVTDCLVIVCNGEIKSQYLKQLNQYTDYIFLRENFGFDATAYKETLEDYLGWKKVLEFDELVLMNDTCFGPFVPFTSIFNTMENRDCDFWGITAQKVPYHIQSYFFVMRKRLLHSQDFREFWRTLKEIRTHTDGVKLFELRLTEYFRSRGFTVARCPTPTN